MSESKLFTVRIRREHMPDVKASSEQIDGMTHLFTLGWMMDEEYPYPGETTWIPDRDGWPLTAPSWIASGDLVAVKEAS